MSNIKKWKTGKDLDSIQINKSEILPAFDQQYRPMIPPTVGC